VDDRYQVIHAMRISHLSALDHPLRRARLRAGYSLRALGAAAAVNYSRLSLIENGLSARDAELRRLAGVLGCRPEDLIPGMVSRPSDDLVVASA
jgi:transcriptional regulator with XRE-family HTH domain